MKPTLTFLINGEPQLGPIEIDSFIQSRLCIRAVNGDRCEVVLRDGDESRAAACTVGETKKKT